MATLWASASDADAIARADTAVLLVGSYDGSGNFGDVLQVLTAIETVRSLPDVALPVAIVERETLDFHRYLVSRYAAHFEGAVFAHFHDDAAELPEDDLVELRPGTLRSAGTALYLYGGGYLNERWAGRKIAHAAAGEALTDRNRAPTVVASGLQVDRAIAVDRGAARELLRRAAWIGVRDVESYEHLRAGMPSRGGPELALAGDDALPAIDRPEPRESGAVVNFHLNPGIWVSDDPAGRASKLGALLARVAEAAPSAPELQPVIAYEDPRVSERRACAELIERMGGSLEAAGYTIAEPLDLLADTLGAGLDRFRRARLTVSSSYHVTLASLVNEIPAALFAENEYYRQKGAGLSHIFGFARDRDPMAVTGADSDAGLVAALLDDGAERTATIEQLRAGAVDLAARHAAGRAEMSDALADGLSGSGSRGWLSRLLGRA